MRRWFFTEKEAFKFSKALKGKHPEFDVCVRFSLDGCIKKQKDHYVEWK